MIAFVTLDEAKAHLRIDTDDGDDDLQQKIYSASASILDYIQSSRDVLVDDDGEVIEGTNELDRVKMATLLLVGILDAFRNAEDDTMFQQGYLPFTVTSLIYSLRSPTII
ncbi:phage gp6-like head-tail connector protein [Pantoea sp. Al-1710]|uniref:Phage gp6-like head-tail connector protein n=1 Tax=Candidatus Pantoea communis TaxID=2608354 RepID=A0ABX0RJK3_9GAMM|nr:MULTISPECIES: head-tail connector protein [Pantoea]NIG13015.1 phage gp6-like head-tail connector protein [Pantoea sp. Cy-640]NIG17284.1 phage gp6-like head-tail connector protein [Pantoea communis]